MDPRLILVELLRKTFPIGYRQCHSLFFVCGFEDSYALASKLEVIGHKRLVLRLRDHDKYSRMLSINLWEELQRLFCYRQHVSIFQALKGDSVGYWSLSGNHTGILKLFFQNASRVDCSKFFQKSLRLQVRCWQVCSLFCGFLIHFWK